jgi:hypothetical protein
MSEGLKPTSDKPAAEAKAEGHKLEWKTNFYDKFEMTWYGVEEKIADLNEDLKEGERPWRLPTKDELIAKFNETGSCPEGFYLKFYWSGDVDSITHEDAYCVSMANGRVNTSDMNNHEVRFVCLVRDTA